jgi:hypothetical protein
MTCSQLFTQPIQDDFSFGRETTKDQYRFRCNRVDDIANFFVVDEQVDELSNLDVVYRDGGFVRRNYNQILLSRITC